MSGKIEGLPREYQRIQTNGRFSIPKRFKDAYGWKDGDQIMVEAHKGRLIIENITAKWRDEKRVE